MGNRYWKYIIKVTVRLAHSFYIAVLLFSCQCGGGEWKQGNPILGNVEDIEQFSYESRGIII